MTLIEPTALSAGAQSSEPATPTIRMATRKSLFWIIAVIVLIGIGVLSLLLSGSAKAGDRFSATNAAPGGSRAIAEVLKSRGVDVVIPATFNAATSSLNSRGSTSSGSGSSRGVSSGGTTLFLFDPESRLSDSRLSTLATGVRTIVLLSPTLNQLRVLAPQVGAAGVIMRSSLRSACDLPAASRAGVVSGAGMGYRLITADSSSQRCFASGGGIYSLISIETSGTTIIIVGTEDAFTNEHVIDRANAALTLSLLGQHKKLVWYLPTIDDATNSAPTLAALTPLWVGSVAPLLAIVAVAAAFWRGRRFGPLVIENLPVIVRSSETMEGRARLYQRNGSRLHALDALRIGALGRLAVICGLPRAATVDEVIAAVASVTGRELLDIRLLLLEDEPENDRQLVQLSDALLELERNVRRDLRPA